MNSSKNPIPDKAIMYASLFGYRASERSTVLAYNLNQTALEKFSN
jgi:hypothetical protein